jgi:hypothetical protein
MSLGRLGGVYALLHASHEVADHWVQTHRDAIDKGEDGWTGRRACARHVATLTATQALTVTGGAWMVGERLSPRRVAAGLAVNAAAHYWADRRSTLARLADRCGKGEFYMLGDGKAAPVGTGAYALDQAFHIGCLAITATIIAR